MGTWDGSTQGAVAGMEASLPFQPTTILSPALAKSKVVLTRDYRRVSHVRSHVMKGNPREPEDRLRLTVRLKSAGLPED